MISAIKEGDKKPHLEPTIQLYMHSWEKCGEEVARTGA